jgi:hypothetical protein
MPLLQPESPSSSGKKNRKVKLSAHYQPVWALFYFTRIFSLILIFLNNPSEFLYNGIKFPGII